MKKVTTAMVVKVTGGADNRVLRILETRENIENPAAMYKHWVKCLKGQLGNMEMVTVETEYK